MIQERCRCFVGGRIDESTTNDCLSLRSPSVITALPSSRCLCSAEGRQYADRIVTRMKGSSTVHPKWVIGPEFSQRLALSTGNGRPINRPVSILLSSALVFEIAPAFWTKAVRQQDRLSALRAVSAGFPCPPSSPTRNQALDLVIEWSRSAPGGNLACILGQALKIVQFTEDLRPLLH